MRRSCRRRCGFVVLVLQIWAVLGTAAPLTAGERARSASRWPAVVVSNSTVHFAIETSLNGASSWLLMDRCQAVLSEFHDQHGRPLTEKLGTLGVDIQTYLRLVHFRDGSSDPQCRSGGTLAYTAAGSRVVWVCGPAFVKQWNVNREVTKAAVLHETLHSLGLGENPPTSREITWRVMVLCG
jgi:hypothetical protein